MTRTPRTRLLIVDDGFVFGLEAYEHHEVPIVLRSADPRVRVLAGDERRADDEGDDEGDDESY